MGTSIHCSSTSYLSVFNQYMYSCAFLLVYSFLTLFCLSCGSDASVQSRAVWVWFAAEQCWEIHNTIVRKRWRDWWHWHSLPSQWQATISSSFRSCGTNTEPRLSPSPCCHLQLSTSLNERYYYWLSIQSKRYECTQHVTTHNQGTGRGHSADAWLRPVIWSTQSGRVRGLNI